MILELDYMLGHSSFESLPEVIKEEIEFGYERYTGEEKLILSRKFLELVDFDEKVENLDEQQLLDYLKEDEEKERITDLVLATKIKREKLQADEVIQMKLEKEELQNLMDKL